MFVSNNFRFINCVIALFAMLIFTPLKSYAQDHPSFSDGDGAVMPEFPDDDYMDNGTASISGPSAMDAPDRSEGFFDADDLVPRGEMTKRGPVKVDPSRQPASKFIIVRKNHKADSKTAQVVAAERALMLGRYDSALEMFNNLYKNSNGDARVIMGRAVALQKLGRFEASMKSYQRLAELEPDNVEIKINMLGLLGMKFPSVALRRLLELNNEHQGHPNLAAQIAVAYANAGDRNSAMKYLGMAASMEPNNANHIYNMAVISDRAGNAGEALTYYEKALELDTVQAGGRSIPRDAIYERLVQIR